MCSFDLLNCGCYCTGVESSRRGDIYIGVTTVFTVVLVIQNFTKSSGSGHRVFIPSDLRRLMSLLNISFVVPVVVVGEVDDIWNEDGMVVVHNVDELSTSAPGKGMKPVSMRDLA